MRYPWLAALLAAILTGCTSAPQTSQLRDSGALARPSSLIAEVPFFAQTTDQCGPAALAALLNFRAAATSPEQLRQQIYLAERGGTLQSDIIAASRAAGLQPYPLAPDLIALLDELEAGNPVLVLQNLGLDSLPRWHYAVAIGYASEEQALILHSGEEAALHQPLALFEQSWNRAQRWALVIVAPDRPPPSATPSGWLQASLALEQTGHPNAAARGYRALTARWPGYIDGWIARANARFAAADYRGALGLYQEALRRDQRNLTAWNNQAYALNALECGGQAIASLHCGLRLDAANPTLLSSLDELRHAARRQADDCPVVLCN